MVDPAKVIGFLDITGDWDPSLAFVMAGAVGVFGLAYRLHALGQRPAHGRRTSCGPPDGRSTWQLVVGSAVFGAGWGLGGLCPGPAVVRAAFGVPRVWVFVAAMLAGMFLFRLRPPRQTAPSVDRQLKHSRVQLMRAVWACG
ncbi:MAG: YeeE/YedE family protein [Comamonadaceae bacterium]|nr:YeeE/YedE family protein [Comamonadaceae bacterium]